MNEVYNKIAIVSLDTHLAEVVAKTLSDLLGMTFCSTEDLLEYELSDPKRFARLTSEEYLMQSEQFVFGEIASFCDVVVSISPANFQKGWEKLSRGCILVFLEVGKGRVKDKINKIMFSQFSKDLTEKADVVVSVKDEEPQKICNKIIESLANKI